MDQNARKTLYSQSHFATAMFLSNDELSEGVVTKLPSHSMSMRVRVEITPSIMQRISLICVFQQGCVRAREIVLSIEINRF